MLILNLFFESTLHRHIHPFQLYLGNEFLATFCFLKEHFFGTSPCSKVFTCPAHFFKHSKNIVEFISSREMSVFNQVYYCLPCISYLTLEAYVLILYSLYRCIYFFHDVFMLLLDTYDSKLMIFFFPVGQLLSNTWEHRVTTVLCKCLCFRLLTSKNQFVHHFLII